MSPRTFGWILLGTLLVASCSASNPVEPTDVTPVALVVMPMSSLTPITASIGSANYFVAYFLTADGGYLDVTNQAAWVSSDAGLLRPTGNAGMFTAVASGAARVIARYQSLEGSLPLLVVAANREVYPQVAAANLPRIEFGGSGQTNAFLRAAQNAPLQPVSAGVTWTSSDPSVATVAGGSVRAVGVGTTLLTVTFNDLTSTYFLSVYPRAR
jgi:hypothetical protein